MRYFRFGPPKRAFRSAFSTAHVCLAHSNHAVRFAFADASPSPPVPLPEEDEEEEEAAASMSSKESGGLDNPGGITTGAEGLREVPRGTVAEEEEDAPVAEAAEAAAPALPFLRG